MTRRALRDRLDALERGREAQGRGVVVIPGRDWPDTEEGMAAMTQAHPHADVILPGRMTFEEWEAAETLEDA